MRRIKLTLAYDGTDFSGWQRQLNARSVQEEIEKALAKMHGHHVSIFGAGRTDSGVHARGQVTHFDSDIDSIPAEKFLVALNRLLPQDIRISEAALVPDFFHARFSAYLRRYRYFIACGTSILPQVLRYSHFIHYQPSISALNSLAAELIGEQDFTSLSSARDESESRYRTVYEAHFFYMGDGLVFEIAANAFLLRMVRSIVGTLLEFEKEKRSPSELHSLLKSKIRADAGTTAPARGLFLWNVEYPADCAPITNAAPAAPESPRLVPGLGLV